MHAKVDTRECVRACVCACVDLSRARGRAARIRTVGAVPNDKVAMVCTRLLPLLTWNEMESSAWSE